jgi:selT/selW/selH-like putative selenoprotein
LTQKILEEFKLGVRTLQLKPFDDGRFEVFADDKLIFSKLASHRFPEYSEIRPALRKARREGVR